jgi:biopolymer transport protein ExbB/TolQ
MISRNAYNTLLSRLSDIGLAQESLSKVHDVIADTLSYEQRTDTYTDYKKQYYQSHKNDEHFKETNNRAHRAYYERNKIEQREKNRLRMKAKRDAARDHLYVPWTLFALMCGQKTSLTDPSDILKKHS